jgi:hypothetical protein
MVKLAGNSQPKHSDGTNVVCGKAGDTDGGFNNGDGSHINSDSDSHSYCNAYSYANCDTDTHPDAYSHAYSYTDGDP